MELHVNVPTADSSPTDNLNSDDSWRLWGPYLSERQWSTIREQKFQSFTDVWTSFTFEDSIHKVYKWSEDGLLGISDDNGYQCLATAIWNGKDKILKEKLFGLIPNEANHGEDVKENYYYTMNLPDHSYMKAQYKYPQTEFPYKSLRENNKKRSKKQREYELNDTDVFNDGKYWDIDVEFVKVKPTHILCRYTIRNRGPERDVIHFLPSVWFRNTWEFEQSSRVYVEKPMLEKVGDGEVKSSHAKLGRYTWKVDKDMNDAYPVMLFTENQSRDEDNYLSKDGFHDFLIKGDETAVVSDQGTKCAAYYKLTIEPGTQAVVNYQFFHEDHTEIPSTEFDQIFVQKASDTYQFYNQNLPNDMPYEMKNVCIQAYAGLLWSKMFYHYPVKDWIHHSVTDQEKFNKEFGVNATWTHLQCQDVLSVPDKWEFPWFAVWDLAFHMIPMAEVDIDFAKKQLLLFLSHRYLSMNGKIPAFDMNFGAQNPPVHAWSCWSIYDKTVKNGNPDIEFLEKAYLGLLPNYSNWVGQAIDCGSLYAGGFLGFDNISAIDRLSPGAHRIYQADGTGWVAFFSLYMLKMVLVLCKENKNYEDSAVKILKQFITIQNAINGLTNNCVGLWDENDKFYYDKIQPRLGENVETLRIRSYVGIVPMFAQCILDISELEELPQLRDTIVHHFSEKKDHKVLLSLMDEDKLKAVLRYILDETEFLSSFGVRSLSKYHQKNPYIMKSVPNESSHGLFDWLWWLLGMVGTQSPFQAGSVKYTPADSDTNDFGGNSNWRGPIWICINFLIIETLDKLHSYFGDNLRVECPTGSEVYMNLKEVSTELTRRVTSIFLPDEAGRRPCYGSDERYMNDPSWCNLLLFHEFFHGETGEGLGASHQTGWTALVATLLRKLVTYAED